MQEEKNKEVKTVVLIPALDPERGPLLDLVSKLLSYDFLFVLLVDDGSSKENKIIFEECKSLGCELVSYEGNRGKGYALRRGFSEILSKKEFYGEADVITADSDGQHTVEDILKVRAEMLAHRGAFVLGVRDFFSEESNKNVPPKSLKGNRFTSKLFKFMYGRWMADTQTGLRGIPYSLLDEATKIKGDRYQYEMKALIKAVRCDVEIIETPIEVIYVDNNKGTHFRPIRDSLKIIGVLISQFLKYSLISLSSSILDIAAFTMLSAMLANVIPIEHIIVSTFIARGISGAFNFLMNKRVVFSAGDQALLPGILKYILTAVIIASLSALFVNVLFLILHWNKTLIKIIVDTLLFFVSYKLQQAFVFNHHPRQTRKR